MIEQYIVIECIIFSKGAFFKVGEVLDGECPVFKEIDRAFYHPDDYPEKSIFINKFHPLNDLRQFHPGKNLQDPTT